MYCQTCADVGYSSARDSCADFIPRSTWVSIRPWQRCRRKPPRRRDIFVLRVCGRRHCRCSLACVNGMQLISRSTFTPCARLLIAKDHGALQLCSQRCVAGACVQTQELTEQQYIRKYCCAGRRCVRHGNQCMRCCRKCGRIGLTHEGRSIPLFCMLVKWRQKRIRWRACFQPCAKVVYCQTRARTARPCMFVMLLGIGHCLWFCCLICKRSD
mmetsp:Transcript_42062/g.127073  ORF Transcript_42062/g.127073 Transcript_42062/m.127073 type:complete len:213 (+) Transcript_42062:769-1407(+)